MTKLDHALALAAAGFHVFPIVAGKKKPPRVKFKGWATRDPAAIRAHWAGDPDDNIGIFTGRYADNEALIVVDVDDKNGKRGSDEVLRLELEGCDLPATRTHTTPSGGRHLVYRCAEPVRQGVDLLGSGLDIRSRGGFIVAPGSSVDAGVYGGNDHPVTPAPAWLIAKLNVSRQRDVTAPVVAGIDTSRAVERAIRYLKDEAPLSVKGQGGDQTAYKVAARVKDFGVDAPTCRSLMLDHWNDRCPPGWLPERLWEKVQHAYEYGLDPVGAASPEADFKTPAAAPAQASTKGHPFEELNKEFAFVLAGGGAHILWETTDAKDRFKLEHLTLSAFNQKFAAQKLTAGKKAEPITVGWMEWMHRRSYDGLVFMPELQSPKRFYNLWRGFSVTPLPAGETPSKDAQAALDTFLEHALVNVCNGSPSLYRWLIGYFAHLVQRPWEKPLVALVFRGEKGVGKNALVERVGELLGNHFLVASNRRYLVGNFNGHLENCLFFALDEAFWSGDKQAEGTLKDLITGKHHVIEHKGKEPYTVDNVTRVAIIGNEDWLVPASHDERRFAVFDVGTGRKQDRAYFQTMRERMEAGGDRLLLRYLQEFDLGLVDVNAAPSTSALLEQKHATLEPVHSWWLACLTEGRIVTSDFGADWPTEVETTRLRDAVRRYIKDRQIRQWVPEDSAIGRRLKACCPTLRHTKKHQVGYVYRFPDLADARASWSRYIGHQMEWPE
jgi:hypothetical protein